MTKPRKGVYKECLQCKEFYYVKPYMVEKTKFCSRSCLALYQRIKIKTNCLICKKEFFHISSRANKAKYCSRLCYHCSQKNRGFTQYTCNHCGMNFNDSASTKRKYCSKTCVNKTIKSIWQPKHTTVRKKMIGLGLIERCEKCGYDEFKQILGIHHKDKNRNNNSKENLSVLCPTCHSLEHLKHICH